MIGFPYTYGDNLTLDEAKENRELFFKKYGSTIIINGVIFAFTKQANAKDKLPSASKQCVEAPQTSPPVFAPIFPPSALVKSRLWTLGGVGSVGWICLTAAATREPTLIIACTSILTYAIGGSK